MAMQTSLHLDSQMRELEAGESLAVTVHLARLGRNHGRGAALGTAAQRPEVKVADPNIVERLERSADVPGKRGGRIDVEQLKGLISFSKIV